MLSEKVFPSYVRADPPNFETKYRFDSSLFPLLAMSADFQTVIVTLANVIRVSRIEDSKKN